MTREGSVPEEAPRQHYGLTLAAMGFSAVAFAFAIPLVIPALPEIQREYGASTSTTTFLITGMMVAAAVATPIIGRLGDMFGKERLLLLTMGVFGVGSLISAAAGSIEVLILGRLFQGVGAGVFPLAFGIVRDEFPPNRVSTGIGLLGSIFGVGGMGLLVSGLIVDNFGLRWIFVFGAANAALAMLATWRFVPESPIKSPAKIDWGGAALMALGLVSLLVAIGEGNSWGWGSPRTGGMIAFGVLVLVAWVAFERKQPEPLVPMDVMRLPGVLIPNLAGLLVGFSLFGFFILVSQFAQTPSSAGFGFGSSPTSAGLLLAPSAVMMLFAGPLSGWLGSHVGSSKVPLLIGAVISAASYASAATFNTEPWMFYLATALNGLGNGFAFAALPNLIIETVDQTVSGVATGVNTIMRMAGGALGGQVVTSIVAGTVAAGAVYPTEVGFEAAFYLEAAVVLAAGVIALALPTGPRVKVAAEHAPAVR